MNDSFERFCDIVIHKFAFLDKLGFNLTDQRADYLRFETETICLEILLSKTGEIDLGVDLKWAEKQNHRSFGLEEFISLKDSLAAEKYRAYIASSSEEMQRGVKKLARDFNIYVVPYIFADRSVFSELENLRKNRLRDRDRQFRLEKMRQAADSAWKSKDFGKIVELLTPFQDFLTPTELGWLTYARKHVNTSK